MKKKSSSLLWFEKFLSYDIHVGQKNKVFNDGLKPFLEENIENTCVFDLSHTYVALNRVRQYIYELEKNGKKILFVGNPKGLEKEFSRFCRKHNHYHIQSWFPALFTNFSKVYQKKRKILLSVKERPSLFFFFDVEKDKDILKEAKDLQIPIMAFVSSEDSLENIDYIIPGNVKSGKGGLFVFNYFVKVFLQAEIAKKKKQKQLEAVKEQRQKKLEMLKKKQELKKKELLERRKRFLEKKRELLKKKERGILGESRMVYPKRNFPHSSSYSSLKQGKKGK